MRKLQQVARDIQTVINKLNGDALVVITSNIYGAGKSTLAMMLARMVWPRWDWREHMTYEPLEFFRILKKQRVKVIVQDEGKRLGKRTDFMQKEVKYLENVLSETRKLNKCIIICVGEMHRLFRWLADEKAVVWLHIPKRGRVLVFQARNYIMDGNKFGVKKDLFTGVRSESDLMRRLTSLPSFCFMDSFPQYHDRFLPEEEFKAYEEMAKNKTLDMIDKVIEDLEEEVKPAKKIDYDSIVQEVFTNAEDYLKTWGKRTFIATDILQARFDIGYSAARKIKLKVENMLRESGKL
jgi:hypothetical protein